ncbi:lanthionine synthetase LanC family protein [Dyadobacter sp. 32]|uniref:lanthionine synthetase LanC family protein n=1 Tax=Dyadobacter sp. 32 TaxID=538966 RepID=UPI0011F02F77
MDKLMIFFNYYNTSKGSMPIGLANGKAGLLFYLMLASKSSKNKALSKQLENLYIELINELPLIEDFGFDNGLCGIGWAFNWLNENGLLNDNTINTFLEDIDNVLYRNIMFSRDSEISMKNGLLGKIIYFSGRLNNHKFSDRFKSIIYQECLIMLTDELEDKLLRNIGVLNGEFICSNRFTDIGNTLIILSNFLKMEINITSVLHTINKLKQILLNCSIDVYYKDQNCIPFLYYNYLSAQIAGKNLGSSNFFELPRKAFTKLNGKYSPDAKQVLLSAHALKSIFSLNLNNTWDTNKYTTVLDLDKDFSISSPSGKALLLHELTKNSKYLSGNVEFLFMK